MRATAVLPTVGVYVLVLVQKFDRPQAKGVVHCERTVRTDRCRAAAIYTAVESLDGVAPLL